MNTNHNKFSDFENRIRKKFKLLRKLARQQSVTCFRFYDHDLPDFPLCIELYEDHLYIAEYVRNHRLDDYLYKIWKDKSVEIISSVTQIPLTHLHFKQRFKNNSRNEQYQKMDVSQHKIIGQENGLKFYLNLQDYVDTGLFLDHRLTRQQVRSLSNGKRVLNLFCYTGSFSVYAAAGGAEEVVSVDMSNTYLSWTDENLLLNNLDNPSFKTIRADVLSFIQLEKSDYYDLIILDPPTFSISKKMEDTLEIQRDHVWLINQCLRCLKIGGQLFFSTNFTKFILEEDKLNSDSIRNITLETTPFDFEGKLRRYCWEIKKDKI